MVPSSSHPELSVAMEAPLEMPALAAERRRQPCLRAYRRWVWLSLTTILTLAITLVVLFYVGALSGNRAPSSAGGPSVQYRHPRPAADLKAEKRTTTPPTTADVENDDDDGDPADVVFVLDIESPIDGPSPSSRGKPSTPVRSAKCGGAAVPNARLHIGLNLGLFDDNFADIHIESSFSVIVSRPFTPEFQQLIPKIGFANGAWLTIYTNRDCLLQHPDAMRFYYLLQGDECPQAVLADTWQLLNRFGPDLRRRMVFVRSGSYLSPSLQDLFLNELGPLHLGCIQRSSVAGDLILASTEPKEPLQLPETTAFANVDDLIARQMLLLASLEEAWCHVVQLWSAALEIPDPQDFARLEEHLLHRLKEELDERQLSSVHQLLPEMREVFEQKAQLPIKELHNSIEAQDRNVRSFAMEIGVSSPTEDPVSCPSDDESASAQCQTIAILNELKSIRTFEQDRLAKLEFLRTVLRDVGIL